MEEKQIKINIKQAADKKFELQVPEKSTIAKIKEECAKNVGCKPTELKLIYKGSLLLNLKILTRNSREDLKRYRYFARLESRRWKYFTNGCDQRFLLLKFNFLL